MVGTRDDSAVRAKSPLLNLRDVYAGYRGVPIIKGASLTVGAAQVALVVGPNGAGKSTLVKAIIGELPLLGGTIIFDGTDVSKWAEERRAVAGLGYVPQTHDVFPTLTVTENLEVGAYRLKPRLAKDAIAKTFERFPLLARLRHRKAKQLSGGERKLLGIARGLIANPALLILDEPTAGLAPKLAQEVLEDVVVGLATSGHAILLIEQRVTLASRIASQVTVLLDGSVRYAASGEEFRSLRDADVADIFFGSRPAMVGHGVHNRASER